MREIKICHVYPDMMNMYGDRGNIIAMQRRLEWRGYAVKILDCTAGDVPESDCDIYMIGDGPSIDNARLMEDLIEKKAPVLRKAAESGRVILGIGGGFQLLCREYRTADGRVLPCLGLIPAYTDAGDAREPGDFSFETDGVTVVGFESHADKAYLDEGVSALGRVIKGSGNNGEDGTEGAVNGTVFGSWSHGPLLPKNSALCDRLLSLAVGEPLTGLDDSFEESARRFITERLG